LDPFFQTSRIHSEEDGDEGAADEPHDNADDDSGADEDDTAVVPAPWLDPAPRPEVPIFPVERLEPDHELVAFMGRELAPYLARMKDHRIYCMEALQYVCSPSQRRLAQRIFDSSVDRHILGRKLGLSKKEHLAFVDDRVSDLHQSPRRQPPAAEPHASTKPAAKPTPKPAPKMIPAPAATKSMLKPTKPTPKPSQTM
jgi:cell division septation protein DedD